MVNTRNRREADGNSVDAAHASADLSNGRLSIQRRVPVTRRSSFPQSSRSHRNSVVENRAVEDGNRSRSQRKRKNFKSERQDLDVTPPDNDSLFQNDDKARRKSLRQRKEVYCSLNETLLVKTWGTQPLEMGHDHQMDNEMDERDECIYDVVKRRKRMRNPEDPAEEEEDTQKSAESEEEDDEAEDDDHHDDESQSCYFLRQNKPVTKRYSAPIAPMTRARKKPDTYFGLSPRHLRHRRIKHIPQHSSPYHSKRLFDRPAKHGGSSTSSSEDSDDEQKFKRRKSKSMARARSNCLPMNFKHNDMVGVLKDRSRARLKPNIGSSLADIDPMTIDNKVTFESVGGLQTHVQSLKEMIVFPLLYPEVFDKFKIAPPRGVLFHGPPGTGKTLLARALANECSVNGQKVAFFMRKGADCLSKWVGESERQLRLLFDQAYTMRPSIIFFDEIDGLAPVRSTRQDQIHSSIVSTLLALMDGLDSRGEIVVIGATNRVDAIDPALRRPGRFDREFQFTLPNREARQVILEIHMAEWKPKLSKAFLCQLAERCTGYCGADLKALCTETILCALRRRYPQIYKTTKKLLLNLDDINICIDDFQNAMKSIVPASQRAIVSPGKALASQFQPLLQEALSICLDAMKSIFPAIVLNKSKVNSPDSSCDNTESSGSIFELPAVGTSTRSTQRISSAQQDAALGNDNFFTNLFQPHHSHQVFRPRIILTSDADMGQKTHLAPALLHEMDHLSVQVLDLPLVFGMSSRTPEEACFNVFREARRTQPSVLYMPAIDEWWVAVTEQTKATFLYLLEDIPPSCPVLLLGTASQKFTSLPNDLTRLFYPQLNQIVSLSLPGGSARLNFFRDLFLKFALEANKPASPKDKGPLEDLPVAPAPEPRQLSATEVNALREEEQNTLRELRLFLRHVCWKLLADRKFKEFSKPVDLEEVPDYTKVIKEPMDLSTIMTKINSHSYGTCADFLRDVDLITNNCLEYNPDKQQFDRHLRNRACEMRDTAHALVYSELDPEFDKSCMEIQSSRKSRGETTTSAPLYLKVAQENHAVSFTNTATARSTRNSMRLRGEEAPDIPYITVPIENTIRRQIRKTEPSKEIDNSAETSVEKSEEVPGSEVSSSSPLKIDSNAAKTEDVDGSDDDIEFECHPLNAPTSQSKETRDEICADHAGLKTASELLLTRIVNATEGAGVDRLEQIYNAICGCLFKFKGAADKSELFKELELIVEAQEKDQK